MPLIKKEIVILLHGIARTKRSMAAIEKALKKMSYQVLNLDYPSRKKSIWDIAFLIFNEIKPFASDPDLTLHFVAHSMGCLVIRALLSKYPILNVGNIVMLAPPNQGSQVADFLVNNFFYRSFYGPAGSELTTDYARKTPFPPIKKTFGVIAGNICLDPISYFILPQGHDGKVTIESTKLEGMKDHIVLPCSHSFMMYNKIVIDQVIFFLKNSHFKS